MEQNEIEEKGGNAFEEIISQRSDLIYLNIDLLEKSRIEICGELRKIKDFNDTNNIIVTALAMKGYKERIMAAGFTIISHNQ